MTTRRQFLAALPLLPAAVAAVPAAAPVPVAELKEIIVGWDLGTDPKFEIFSVSVGTLPNVIKDGMVTFQSYDEFKEMLDEAKRIVEAQRAEAKL